MIFKNQLILLLYFCILGFSSCAQYNSQIPLSEDVKTGKLKNGMTYYIMHNEEPKNRVSYYFVQNVGAILESDSQNGLAHFLEHMAFNGLQNFPGKSMLDYLEKNGILFGRDINAYTAQDETVYNLSNLPSTNENLLDSALLVLHDWSGGLLLEGKEIEAERGVIHEEWRTRRTVDFRLHNATNPTILNHSKYAERDVIGSLDIIDNFKHQELRDYYKKWYRPDLQAVVIVGDVDIDKMEKKVQNLFSKIPMPKNAAKRTYAKVEDSKEIAYVAAKDKEAKSLNITWFFRRDMEAEKTELTRRNKMAKNMAKQMLAVRIAEKVEKQKCSALGMQIGGFDMVRTKAADFIYVSPKPGKELEAFAEVLSELERLKRYGFKSTELDRMKTQFLRSYESYSANYSKISNDQHAKALGDLYLKAKPFPSIEWEMEFANRTIPTINLEEVNAFVNFYSNEANSALILKGPDKEEQFYPSKEELLAISEKVKNSKLEDYEDKSGNKPLIDKKLNPAKIESTFKIDGIDAKGYVLENGARVVILPTNYSKDQIVMSSFSFGGTSLINTKDLACADMATALVQMSGLGEFNTTQLGKKLTGKIANVGANIGSLTEGFSGTASPQDFETMMQLLYLHFEAPRFDKDLYDAHIARMRNYVANSKVNNNKAIKDTITLAKTNYSPRSLLFNDEFIDKINFKRVCDIYKERFSNASDFTFVFVGNMEKKQLQMIQKYIGNLSSSNKKETYIDHKVGPAKGKTVKRFKRQMEVPKTTVSYSLNGEFKYTLKNRLMLNVVSQLLSKRYMTTIREEEGGSYGVGVNPSAIKLPAPSFTMEIQFNCDPAKCNALMKIVEQEIEKIQTEKCNASDLTEIKNNFIKGREELELQNSFWIGAIQKSLILDCKFYSLTEYKKLVEEIDASSILKFSQQYLKNTNIVEVIMSPQEK